MLADNPELVVEVEAKIKAIVAPDLNPVDVSGLGSY